MSNSSSNRAGVAVSAVLLTITVLVIGGLIFAQSSGVDLGFGGGAMGRDSVYDASDVDIVDVDVLDVAVVVLPSPDDSIHVTLPQRADIRVTQRNGALSIAQQITLFDGWNNSRQAMYLYIPDAMLSVRAQTASGSVEVEGISCDVLTASTSSGRISVVDAACAGDLAVNTYSGSVDASYLTADSIDVHSMSGRIEADGFSAPDVAISTVSGRISGELPSRCNLDVSTTSGRIDLSLSDTVNGSVTSVSGSITLSVDSEQTVRCSTLSGGIHLDGDRISGKTGILQRGADALIVDTTSGSIEVLQ